MRSMFTNCNKDIAVTLSISCLAILVSPHSVTCLIFLLTYSTMEVSHDLLLACIY